LLKDIDPGPEDSYPASFVALEDSVFFFAGDGLWKTDGTAAGTELVAAGLNGGFTLEVGGTLLFVGNDGVHGMELWRSDGTAGGTALVEDILVGGDGVFAGHPLVQLDGRVFFSALGEPWMSDGTADGVACDAEAGPAGSEACNRLDDDCDGTVDDGLDQDGDTVLSCAGDCDDADATVYPGAPEINDGKDNQCAGDAGFGVKDELTGSVLFSDEITLTWQAQTGATSYQVARSKGANFASGCALFLAPGASLVDTAEPLAGESFFYLIRPRAPNRGSWGKTSAGVVRTGICLPL
jgi:ELWxxDGT repeat protein